jgi:hypothetical protein
VSGAYDPLNLAPALRAAVLQAAPLSTPLALYENEPGVFTRRPVPSEAGYPMCVISPPVSVGDVDFLKARFPTPRYDIGFYGRQPDDYRVVENLAFLARRLFHRNRFALDLVPDYAVMEIVATGPMAAPTDSAQIVGRMILLRFKLEDLTAG